MVFRQRFIAAILIVVVLLLAAFAMWVILLRVRPLDPEGLRAPGFTSTHETGVVA